MFHVFPPSVLSSDLLLHKAVCIAMWCRDTQTSPRCTCHPAGTAETLQCRGWHRDWGKYRDLQIPKRQGLVAVALHGSDLCGASS